MLLLRQFDASIARATYSGIGSRVPEHMASTVLDFAAQPSDQLPAFIASFTHPARVDSSLAFETDHRDIMVDGAPGEDVNVIASTPETPTV